MTSRDSAVKALTVGEAVCAWIVWYSIVTAPLAVASLQDAVGRAMAPWFPSAPWYTLPQVIIAGATPLAEAAALVLGILSLAGRASSRHAARLAGATLIMLAVGWIPGLLQSPRIGNSWIVEIAALLMYLLGGTGLTVWSFCPYSTMTSGWRFIGKLILGCAALSAMSWVARSTANGWATMAMTAMISPMSFAAHLAPLVRAILYAYAGWMLLSPERATARRGRVIAFGICGSCLLTIATALTSAWLFADGVGHAVLRMALGVGPAALAGGLLLMLERHHWVLASPEGSCSACGYLLCGLPDDTDKCPECGGVFRSVSVARPPGPESTGAA